MNSIECVHTALKFSALSALLAAQASAAPAWHPSYEPPVSGMASNSSVAVTEPSGGLQGGVGNTDTRYAPTGPLALAPAAGGIKLCAWRGERVNAQIVVTAGATQANLRVESAVLRNNTATHGMFHAVSRWVKSAITRNGASAIPVQANFVRYTLGNVTGEEWKNNGGVITNFTKVQPHGDILDTELRLTLAAGANRPIWLTVDVPADAAPGNYGGTLTVRTDAGALEFPIVLEVLAATLPAPKDWPFHLDLWQQPEAVARYHRVPLWSPEHFALLKPLMKRLADAGQKTITCSLFNEPWGAQTYDWIPGMIEWRKKANGSWAYDYSIFDKWVTFMSDEVGMSQARIHCYSMVPWSLKFRYYDEAKQATVDAELRPGTPEYDAYWGRFLKDFTRHLASKGWLERTRISMDERPDELMRGALTTLAKHAPELKVASAINRASELTRDVDDISPGLRPGFAFPADELAARRQAGKRTTFYVCCHPPRPNTFTFSPPAEAEWLGLFAAANGFDGFLNWAYCSWVEDPLVSTDYARWPSGSCFLVYPGNRSSVRFERLRDGIEDFEKIRLLREWAAAAPSPEKQAALARLDAVLKDFSWPRGAQAGIHTEDVRRAVEAITAATRDITPAATKK